MKLSELEANLEREAARAARLVATPFPPPTIIATPEGGSVKIGEFSPFSPGDAIATILRHGHSCNLTQMRIPRPDAHLGAVEL